MQIYAAVKLVCKERKYDGGGGGRRGGLLHGKKMEALEAPHQMPVKRSEPVHPWLLSVTVASNASRCCEKAVFVCFRALHWL